MQRCCEMVQSLLRCTTSTQRCPFHVLNIQVLQLLQTEGYIRGFCVEGTKINILLKFYQGAPVGNDCSAPPTAFAHFYLEYMSYLQVIRNIRVVSKPSRDIWVTPSELKYRTRFNTGLWVMQTTCGIISHHDCIAMGVGGKMMFAVNNGYQHFC
ncbi:putative ribosomal protein S8 [Cardiosporidium cionae]|uniref:Ribosomal protein S8 n=1 Tax=Cardiosporidium cionae TaxID=476202 RepID=A0ABQ7JFJ1_9APIC|nr:putative ribosomal protein S8 [Cardiosporidium cionae]|eukprot:KAF8822787.1 putative ribosomal protein S8 [Cardiosporidium cionae]